MYSPYSVQELVIDYKQTVLCSTNYNELLLLPVTPGHSLAMPAVFPRVPLPLALPRRVVCLPLALDHRNEKMSAVVPQIQRYFRVHHLLLRRYHFLKRKRSIFSDIFLTHFSSLSVSPFKMFLIDHAYLIKSRTHTTF